MVVRGCGTPCQSMEHPDWIFGWLKIQFFQVCIFPVSVYDHSGVTHNHRTFLSLLQYVLQPDHPTVSVQNL